MPAALKKPPTPLASDPFRTANRLFFRLYQSSNLMHKAGTSAVSEHGVTTQQWAVLGALSRKRAIEEGLSVKQLMEFLMVSRQSLTAILDRLEAAGLVERVKTDGDGRLRHVRLTQAGTKMWSKLLPKIHGFYESALADLSLEEAFLLMRLLDRLTAGLAKL